MNLHNLRGLRAMNLTRASRHTFCGLLIGAVAFSVAFTKHASGQIIFRDMPAMDTSDNYCRYAAGEEAYFSFGPFNLALSKDQYSALARSKGGEPFVGRGKRNYESGDETGYVQSASTRSRHLSWREYRFSNSLTLAGLPVLTSTYHTSLLSRQNDGEVRYDCETTISVNLQAGSSADLQALADAIQRKYDEYVPFTRSQTEGSYGSGVIAEASDVGGYTTTEWKEQVWVDWQKGNKYEVIEVRLRIAWPYSKKDSATIDASDI